MNILKNITSLHVFNTTDVLFYLHTSYYIRFKVEGFVVEQRSSIPDFLTICLQCMFRAVASEPRYGIGYAYTISLCRCPVL